MRLPHGIRRAFPTACAGLLGSSCLPILALFSAHRNHNYAEDQTLLCAEEEAQDAAGDEGNPPQLHEAANQDLQPHLQSGQDNGILQPLSGEEGDLLPQLYGEEDTAVNTDLQNLQCEEMGRLLPVNGEVNGFLLPNKRGDEKDDHADKMDLHPPLQDRQYEEGITSPPFQQQNEVVGMLLPRLGVAIATERMDMKTWYVYTIHSWLMPSPRPRVKMKGDCKMLNDAHAWEHDAWAFPSSPSTSSINTNLADAERVHLTEAASHIFYMPFTPLRGRDRCQGREMKAVEMKKQAMMMSKPKLETMIMMMQMQLSYLTKDVLDPG